MDLSSPEQRSGGWKQWIAFGLVSLPLLGLTALGVFAAGVLQWLAPPETPSEVVDKRWAAVVELQRASNSREGDVERSTAKLEALLAEQ